MTNIEQLLINLLHIPSLSGKEEVIGDFLVAQLSGFVVERQYISKNRFNVVGRKGTPKRWLVAHMDTVSGNVPIRVTKDAIFGRGACDNKQSIAASMLVGQTLDNIGLLFTVGEEYDFAGAKKAQSAGIGGDLVVIQEPTNFEIVTGCQGVITFTITAHGVAQHSSQPHTNNANKSLLRILQKLDDQQWTAFNIGLLSGGQAVNIVSDHAQATISVRPQSFEEYTDIHTVLEGIKNVEIQLLNDFPPQKSNLGFPEKIALGFSEMAFFNNSIEFGAGDPALSHSDNEHISRRSLNMLPDKLETVLTKSKT